MTIRVCEENVAARRGSPSPLRKVAVDFRRAIPTNDRYLAVYAPWTRQNKSWSNGDYRIDVAATDTRGNRSLESFEVSIRNGVGPA